jgi:hypothetical protein
MIASAVSPGGSSDSVAQSATCASSASNTIGGTSRACAELRGDSGVEAVSSLTSACARSPARLGSLGLVASCTALLSPAASGAGSAGTGLAVTGGGGSLNSIVAELAATSGDTLGGNSSAGAECPEIRLASSTGGP